MKISVRNNYTKHQLSVESKILNTLEYAISKPELSGGLLLREIKEILTDNNPGLKTSIIMIREIVDDLVDARQVEVANPKHVTWRRVRLA